MSFERILKKPRNAINDSDGLVRQQAFSIIVKEPVVEDRVFFERMLENDDPLMAFLAHKGLSKLFPMPSSMKEVWRNLFLDTIDLLEKRASSGAGSTQIRVAALKAMALATDVSFSSIDSTLKSLSSIFSYDTSFICPEPLIPLLQKPNHTFLSEGFGMLLASKSVEQEATIKILTRELDCQNPDRLVPALISLQLNPTNDVIDQVIWIARNGEKRVADEAVRALLACGGKSVYLVITSLLKEVKNVDRRLAILPVAAATDREEMWPVLMAFAKGKDLRLALSALRATEGFAGASVSDKLVLYEELIKNKEPELMALAALLAWKSGSSKSLKILKQMLESEEEKYRLAAIAVFPEVSPEKAIPIIISCFESENNENVIGQMFLCLRSLFPFVKKVELVENVIIPWLKRLIKSSDDFVRNQIAVLCGCLGPYAEKLILKALQKEKHSYVIASLLSALGKCGCNRILLYSKYHDHEDARVRANMIESLGNCGSEAVSYLSDALNDNSSRVRAIAAYNLFMLGQLDAIKTLNSMLQVPEPLSVLSACYAFHKIFKTILPKLEADHSLALAISRLALESQRNKKIGPGLLNAPEAPDLFNEMASAAGDRKKLIWILEDKHKRRPSSFVISRLLAAMYILNNDNHKALPLMENCVRENPGDLADLLDAYRTVLKLGDLSRANELGEKTKKLYKMLLDGCIELCRGMRGTGTALMLQRLNFLTEPSMNLYNAMIQLKVVEEDTDTVMYLMTELILSRPFNVNLINKLATLMTDEDFASLREALLNFSHSITI